MKHFLKRLLSLLLCLALCGPGLAFAEGEDVPPSLVSKDELDTLIQGYLAANNLNPDNISVGYYYSGTGERYYYNENKWYYSASMYKVPLMMILAEREYNGELTQQSVLNGLTLEYAEESILVYSNNDFAHLMMNYIGTDRQCRELYQNYSDMPIEDYDPDFYDYSYFTVRFMTDVMVTLFNEPERFPHIIDRLKEAQPGEYFRKYLGGEYEIAQKYGCYKEFNGTTGIIYTGHPFILTVMTRSIPNYLTPIQDLSGMLAEYTEELDEQYAQWEEEQAEAARIAEAEARAAEEAAREQERLAAEAAAQSVTMPLEEDTPAPTELPAATPAPASEARQRLDLRILMLALMVVAVGIILILAIRAGKRRRIREARRRKREAELRVARQELQRTRRELPPEKPARQDRHYTPKH